MPSQDFVLHLEEDSRLLPSRRLAMALIRAIREGRLPSGAKLPGSRVLAERLNLNRNTVLAALHDLEAEGWLCTEPNRGTFVANPLPEMASRSTDRAHAGGTPNFDIPSRLSPLSEHDPEALWLADGLPDSTLFPAVELAKAYQRALHRHSVELLQSEEPLGNRLLRTTLVDWLRERRAIVASPDQILITRGSRMALTLLARGLFRDGDAVAVEHPGHRESWEILRQGASIDLCPIPVDEEGLDVGALESVLRQRPLRALLLRPQRSYPTAAVLSQQRRNTLMTLASSKRMVVIEDDFHSEYAFEEAPPAPLASQDATGQVIFVGSISNLIAPGLELTFIVAPESLTLRLARLQRSLGSQGDRVLEWAVADLIRDDVLARHLRRAKRIYRDRRDFLLEMLEPFQERQLHFTPPSGGLSVWVRPAPGVDLTSWVVRARREGLILHRPDHFSFDGSEPGTMIGFSQTDEAQLKTAVLKLHRAFGNTP